MARREHYFSLSCPSCGKSGSACGHDNDNGPNFSIDTVSDDFKQGTYSPNPWKQVFKCRCGTTAEVSVS